MAEKKEYYHVDAIGRPLKVGDPVATPISNTALLIGTITSMGEKQVRVVKFGEPSTILQSIYREDGPTKLNGKLRYSKEVVLLDGPDLTMYLLKNANK